MIGPSKVVVVRQRRSRRAFAVVLAVIAGTGIGLKPVDAAAPPTPVPPAAIRAAKVGWSWFVADNFATPDAIVDACPLAPPQVLTNRVRALGLVPSALPPAVTLRNDFVGTGIVSIVCGVDLSRSADPTDSTGATVEATVLDGQAVFPQHVVRVAGLNTPIIPSAELGGEVTSRCRFDPTVCVASWHGDGLVITARLDGPRTDASEGQVAQFLRALVPRVVATLATVVAPP